MERIVTGSILALLLALLSPGEARSVAAPATLGIGAAAPAPSTGATAIVPRTGAAAPMRQSGAAAPVPHTGAAPRREHAQSRIGRERGHRQRRSYRIKRPHRAEHRRRPDRAPRRPVVTREDGLIAAGRPSRRVLRPGADNRRERRALAEQSPAFTTRPRARTDRYGAPIGPDPYTERTAPLAADTQRFERRHHRRRRPDPPYSRAAGALAGSAYAGEVIADEALRNMADPAFSGEPLADPGSQALDERPGAGGGRQLGVGSGAAGGASSLHYDRGN